MFAQAPHPEALQIGLWLISATAVLQAIGSALSISRFFMNRAEKRQVSISPDIVARPDFEAHLAQNKQEHANLFSRLGGLERGLQARFDAEIKTLREEGREDIRALHVELNDVARKVSSLEAFNTLQSQRLAEINAKLDRVIERQKEGAAAN